MKHWKHGCLNCVFLGQVRGIDEVRFYDLYFCSHHGPQGFNLVARYGDDPNAWIQSTDRNMTPLHLAEVLALKKGYITRW